jgi:predicted dithiol-disulfide oxidoreductase (DUF899 family)
VPVTDQDRAVAFYVGRLGFEVRMDAPVDQTGGRWIELAPPGAATTIALAPAGETSPAGVTTGIRLTTDDAGRLHNELSDQQVDVGELLNWPGVPPMFEFRDPDGNGLVMVQVGAAASSGDDAPPADLPAARPPIVSAAEWERARESLLLAEKEATRVQDALAARRRRLPMVKFGDQYEFATPAGPKRLAELFDGRTQLVVYQFMDAGPDNYCPGCTWLTNNIPAAGPALLAETGVTWMNVSDMPLEQIQSYKARMGWSVPFVSSRGTSFAADCGAGGGFMLTVFLRDGDDVYRTYNSTSRGVDGLVFANKILDLTPYGRQQDWEDSPAGWPQAPTYG